LVTDREEGLVMVSVGTLVDGDPDNNYLDKETVIRFNPDRKLTGAMHSYMAGTNLFVLASKGLFVLALSNTNLNPPTIVGELTSPEKKGEAVIVPMPAVDKAQRLVNPRAIAVQFRYAFITDDDGLKVIDISEPTRPKFIPSGFVPLKHAGRLYVARTYAYVPNGTEGLAIIDIENPEKPKLDQMFNAGGALNDSRAVQIGSVNASMFALVADGRNGLRVLQMISPDTVPGHMGFSPRPNPKLIATYHTHGEAVAVSRGLDRDRVVDETGNQTVVFGRRGSRPFNLAETKKFYRHADGTPYAVEDLSNATRELRTKQDGSLSEPREIKHETETQLVQPRPQRLMRRGTGE
jgi:hypothetical protein